MVHPDGLPGGWESVVDGAHPSVLDEIIEREAREDAWADELTGAIEFDDRRRCARGAALRIGVLDLYDLLAAGEVTGRCERTERDVAARIRRALAEGGPWQGHLPLPMPATRPRPPSRRGRPRGTKRAVVTAAAETQGMLI